MRLYTPQCVYKRFLIMRNPFRDLQLKEWILYSISLIVVVGTNFFAAKIDVLNMVATIFGVTALIFIAKGNVFGQVLAVIFGALYAVSALDNRYYSETITYLGMSVPVAIASIVSWVKNPYKKGVNVVKIRKFTTKEGLFTLLFSAIVTTVFFFVLKALGTNNLIVSTISIATSFSASYLMFRRISYYAVAYALNDIVLIVLWILASIKNLSDLTMVACFAMFLINDLYAFISWKIREVEQSKHRIKND